MLIASLLLASAAIAADIDPLTTETRYVDQANRADAISLGSTAFAPGELVTTWHAGQGPELYSAVCVTVAALANTGDVVKLGLYALNTSNDLPEDLVWYAEVDASTTGRKCASIASGTILDGTYFDTLGNRLEMFSNRKLAKGAVVQGTEVRLTSPGAYAVTTYGRYDDGSADGKAITSMRASGVTGALPTDLTGLAAPSYALPPSISLEVF